MKRILTICLLALSVLGLKAQNRIFLYSPAPDKGLHVALSINDQWVPYGQICASDYSEWGSEKKMYDPFALRASDGSWRVVWTVNNYAPTFASAYTADLVNWRPQEYPRMSQGACLAPVIVATGQGYDVVYKHDGAVRVSHASEDFRRFSPDENYAGAYPAADYSDLVVDGKTVRGQIFDVDELTFNNIKTTIEARHEDESVSRERMYNDIPVVGLNVYKDDEKAISDKLIGIFFEDISFAADGGLYAELIRNRDFEFSEADKKGWDATKGWLSDAEMEVSVDQPLSAMNPHHLIVSSAEIRNTGFYGIAVKAGAGYDFSFFARNVEGKSRTFELALLSPDGKTLTGKTRVKVSGSDWTRYKAKIYAVADCDSATFVLRPIGAGKTAVDMVSLFPQDTYKGHGLRKDIAEAIEALHPKFVRFPGGCMTHGQGLDNIYHWSESIGEWQDRKPEPNIWRYHQTKGLGFYEYFQWCEDMGAEPLPVLAAGVCCQNSHADEHGYGGQQGGIPMEEMQAYCDEICALIEWANGDPATSRWAKMRADAGHPAPFNLKYLGIGNEDLITTVFEERALMIAKAVKARYPEIIICGTAGPFHAPSADYAEGWEFAHANKDVFDLIDEHYYESSGWFLNHRDYYDSYDRQGPKVYLGEYAAKADVNRSSLESALAEAIYLTDIERNGDIVAMTSYAPLLCNVNFRNWDPDMIYFDNTKVMTTPGYETQRIFGNFSGDRYVKTLLNGRDDVLHRLGASLVRDSKSGKMFLKLVNANPYPVCIDIEGLELNDSERQGVDGFTGFDSDPREQKVRVQAGLAKKMKTNSLLLPAYSFNVLEF